MSGLQQSHDADTTAPVLSLRLPLTVNAYNQWSLNDMGQFYFCGESVADCLHRATADYWPLGEGLCIMLFGSPSINKSILAVASEATADRGINPNSNIILFDTVNRNNDDNNATADVMGMSTLRVGSPMRARTTDGGKVAFSFQVEVGAGSEKRKDVFSWIRGTKKDEDGLENVVYELMRHPLKPQQHPETVNDLSSPTRYWPAHDMCNEDKTIAVLSYEKHWQSSSSSLWRHMFAIQFTGEDVLREMGDDLARTILVTAASLRVLDIIGRAGE
ncbi:hypothetical protein F4860DRAFT_512396 [Xylaria cubensis]|nr:hypothetical protein F4860DRAFT_512396 [Xylaria cubensis]